MLDQRRRRWANIGQTLGRCVVFAGYCNIDTANGCDYILFSLVCFFMRLWLLAIFYIALIFSQTIVPTLLMTL